MGCCWVYTTTRQRLGTLGGIALDTFGGNAFGACCLGAIFALCVVGVAHAQSISSWVLTATVGGGSLCPSASFASALGKEWKPLVALH